MSTQYQPGIPTGTVNLDQDYINIRNNFTQLNTTYSVDHVAYSVSENNGYHKDVHLIPVAAPPAATAAAGQVYTQSVNDSIATDQILYYLTGGNRRVQLTRNFEPVSGTTGKTFLPGGLILQWGFQTTATHFSTGDTGTITFPQPFPTACYLVWTQLMYTTNITQSTGATVSILRDPTPTDFTWNFSRNGPGQYTKFLWIALGI